MTVIFQRLGEKVSLACRPSSVRFPTHQDLPAVTSTFLKAGPSLYRLLHGSQVGFGSGSQSSAGVYT